MPQIKIQPREYHRRPHTVRAALVESTEPEQRGAAISFRAKQGTIKGQVGDFIVFGDDGAAEFWTFERFAAEYEVDDETPPELTLEVSGD